LRFERLTIEQGLSQNTVTSIAQDRTGFLWFGTEDGLNRYDGYTFVTFRNDPKDSASISNDYISSIFLSHEGQIWIGTRAGGIDIYNDSTRTFRHMRHDAKDANTISSDRVEVITEDRSGYFWFGTADGLDRFDPHTRTFLHFRNNPNDPASLPNNFVSAILEDSKGVLWVGLGVGGLHRFDPANGTFKHYRGYIRGLQLRNDAITSITEDREGTMWLGTLGGGLHKYDRIHDTFSWYTSGRDTTPLPFGMNNDFIRPVLEDHHGEFWVGGEEGLVLWDRANERATIFRSDLIDPTSLSQNFITVLFEDRTQNLWIGTEGGGVNKFDLKAKAFHLYEHESGNPKTISVNRVMGLLVDRSDELWVGTWLGGLNHFEAKQNTFVCYASNPGARDALSSSIIYTMLQDAKDTIWVGTAWGMDRFDTRTKKFTTFLPSDIDLRYPQNIIVYPNNVYSILADDDGSLWAATNNGLYNLDKKRTTWTRWLHDDTKPASLASNQLYVLFKDSKKRFWVGTNGGGLELFDRTHDSFVHYRNDPQHDSTLSNNVVNTIYESTTGDLWIGTNSGLNRFNDTNGTFRRYTEHDGLPNGVIHGILEDTRSNLWFSTNRGIVRFTPLTGVMRTYSQRDGLQGLEFSNFSAVKSRNGEMWFGGINGLNGFFPDSIYDNPFIPALIFTSFQVFNQEERLPLDISLRPHLYLKHGQNVARFEFAALDFTAPEQNQYAYMLDGFDKDWVISGNKHTSTYTSLDPGDYTFSVKGSNSDGVWNETAASIVLTVEPPFWGTLWFRSVIVLALGYAGWFTYSRRVIALENARARQQEVSRRLIETSEEMRRSIAAELHDSLGQNLLVIKNRVVLAQRISNDASRLQSELSEISNVASDAINEVREIARNLRPHQLDRLGLTETIRSSVERIAKTSDIKFTIEIEQIDSSVSKETEINIFRIVQEGVSNVLKHSHAAEASVFVRKEPGVIKMLVGDDGRGFDTSVAPASGGFGLAGIAERVRFLSGTLAVDSIPGRGTTLRITIPVNEHTPS
jgi:signal transduction histidine kinase/ligand-binding sensor domain-containing protein